MRRVLLVALSAGVLLASGLTGCGKKEEPQAPASTGAAKRETRHARAVGRADDSGGKMTAPGVAPEEPTAASTGPTGPNPPREMPKELVSAAGQKITLFGPVGPQLLGAVTGLGAASDVTIEGDNTKGKIKSKVGEFEMESTYSAEDYAADRFGAKLPPEATRNSGFVVEGLMPEAMVQQALQAMSGPAGPDAKPVEVTEADRKMRIEGTTYVTKGNASETAAKVGELSKGTYNALPEMGAGMGMLQGSQNLHRMMLIQQVPDSDTVQISALEVVAAPKYLLQFLEQLPAMLEGMRKQMEEMRRQRQQGGAGPQGAPGGADGAGAPGP